MFRNFVNKNGEVGKVRDDQVFVAPNGSGIPNVASEQLHYNAVLKMEETLAKEKLKTYSRRRKQLMTSNAVNNEDATEVLNSDGSLKKISKPPVNINKKNEAPTTNLLSFAINPEGEPMPKPIPLISPAETMPFPTSLELEPGNPLNTAYVKEVKRDCSVMQLPEGRVGLFSWAKINHPKVIIYEVEGDDLKLPWLFLPYPAANHAWICYYMPSTLFRDTNYVLIPGVNCVISATGLEENIKQAILCGKTVVFDVKSEGVGTVEGKIYFCPNLPNVLVCGPFRKTKLPSHDYSPNVQVYNIEAAIKHAEGRKSKGRKRKNKVQKPVVSSPTLGPVQELNSNVTEHSVESSMNSFMQVYLDMVDANAEKINTHQNNLPQASGQRDVQVKSAVALNYADLGFPNRINDHLRLIISPHQKPRIDNAGSKTVFNINNNNHTKSTETLTFYSAIQY